MRKILIIEDSQKKLDSIKSFLSEEFPLLEFVEKKSYNSASKEIILNYREYDLILLDMTMTTYDISVEESGGQPEPLAGANILRAMHLRELPTKVVVVTMYESFVGKKLQPFDVELRKAYPNNYVGYVFFSHQSNEWKNELKKYIKLFL